MLKEYLSEEQIEEIKNIEDEVYKALELVTILFDKETDKGGHPYIVHLISVYKGVHTKNQKVIALLHDVIEDKHLTHEDLKALGFKESIIKDVEILTRVKPKEYTDYINDILESASVDALNVKLADLKNNIDLSRIKNPTMKDYERVEKRYAPAYEKIYNKLKEMESINDRY